LNTDLSNLKYKDLLNEWKKFSYKYFWGDPRDFRFFAMSKIPNNVFERVLDIGCSVGVVLNQFRSKNHFGIDIDFQFLKLGKKIYPDTEFIAASANYLPFCDNVFDQIVSIHTLDIYEIDQEKITNEIIRLSTKDAKLFLTGNWYKSRKKPTINSKEKINGSWIPKLEKNFDLVVRGYHRPKMKGFNAKLKRILLLKTPNFIFKILRLDQLFYNEFKKSDTPIPMEPYIVTGLKK